MIHARNAIRLSFPPMPIDATITVEVCLNVKSQC
jgi:hypothetical protein